MRTVYACALEFEGGNVAGTWEPVQDWQESSFECSAKRPTGIDWRSAREPNNVPPAAVPRISFRTYEHGGSLLRELRGVVPTRRTARSPGAPASAISSGPAGPFSRS